MLEAPYAKWSMALCAIWASDRRHPQRLAAELIRRHEAGSGRIQSAVSLKPDNLMDHDARIVAHFTSLADDYRKFLLSSVWTANAGFLNETNPPEIKKASEARASEAAKSGVLADFNPVPYRSAAATTGSPSASTPSAAPTAPPKPLSYLGTWAAAGVTCAAVKNHLDERAVTFTAKEAQWYESSYRKRSD